MSDHQKATVEKYIQSLCTKNMDGIKEIFADNATIADPVGTEIKEGINAIIEFYQTAFDMNVQAEFTGDIRIAGNSAAFPFQVKAPGMNINVIDVFEFNDEGKVVSMKAYWGEENVTPT